MPHVVVVEDDKMNARLFEAILRRRGGFQVTTTEDVEEILRLAGEGTVDLIIMDVSLSNSEYGGRPVSGLEITRRIKDDPATSAIPVILATAHAMQGDRERFLVESRADDYVSKPILDQAGLVQKVRNFIREKEEGKV